MLILVFDTETTGLPKSKFLSKNNLKMWPHIVQFSYVLYDSEENKVIKMNDSIIKLPENIEISKDSTEIHGITNEISNLKGRDITVVLKEFFADFNNSEQVVAHNLNFDLNMIKVELFRIIMNSNNDAELRKMFDKYHENLNSSKRLYCTMQETIEYCNILTLDKNGLEYQKYPKLIELYTKMFNQTPKNLHNSLNDVVACLRCFMMWKHNVDILKNNKVIESFISTHL